MNSYQLNEILSSNLTTKTFFKGIYDNSSVNPQLAHTKNSFFIVNTSSDPSVMGHWVLFYINEKKELFFMCSLGFKTNFYKKDINRFYHNFNGNKYHVCDYRIQQNTSLTCGAFCIYFCYHIAKNISPLVIFKKFSKQNISRNETKVKHLVYRLAKIRRGCNRFFCPSVTFELECHHSCRCN